MPAAVRCDGVVCVPARDEAGRIGQLLRSLASQHRPFGSGALRVVVAANNCRDGTAAIARGFDGGPLAVKVLECALAPELAHVGTARRMAFEAGLDWLRADGIADGVLLTTDADAEVPPTWVEANRDALGGAEIVGGRLAIRHETPPGPALEALHARIERYWSFVRALEDIVDPPLHDPSPRHGDHTGASLALRMSTYVGAGGLPPLPRGEDNALVARVREAGGRVRHAPTVSVSVSGRASGRAEGGMATEMVRRQAIAGGGSAYLLPSGRHWLRQLERRASLRRSWHDGPARAAEVSLAMGADPAVVDIGSCRNDIAFVERAARDIESRAPAAETIPLAAAIAELDTLLAQTAHAA